MFGSTGEFNRIIFTVRLLVTFNRSG